MLPIRDLNPTRTTPYVNYTLLVFNIAAFVWEYYLIATGGESWVVPGYGLVPSRITNDPPGELFTVLTSMFMHGGLGHLASNLLFLYIFGDNVEDAVGHFRYIAFYLLSGFGAAAAQVLTDPASPVPMVGASGAIAGVLGAYMVLFPTAPVTVLNPIPLLWLFLGFFIVVPAWLLTGLWFAMNLLSGFDTLGLKSAGGVAFFAHVGGFLTGMLAIRPMVSKHNVPNRARWNGFRPPQRNRGGYGDSFRVPRPGPGRWDPWR